MPAFVHEWLDLVVRWAHIVAAIMWIGDSFLFMWLDSHLSKALIKPREGDLLGELYMTHGGGFYEVVKRKTLTKEELPPTLYWFKWESYSTWITGFLLILIVYWLGGRAMLVEADSTLSYGAAVALSVGLLFGGVGVYDLLARTPIGRDMRVFGAVGLIVVVALAWGLMQVMSARAVFLQIGAMLGTVMASNVFLRIIPSQKRMLASTRAGEAVDPTPGINAKKHSTHNHYLTMPVLLLMLSNHFPGVYAQELSWLILGLVCVTGVGVKYAMNKRTATHPLIVVGTLAAFVAAVAMTAPRATATTLDAGGPRVSYAEVKAILEARCTSCHAAKPTNPSFGAAPVGVKLETPLEVVAQKERILVRTVQTKTMPLGNLTGMTDEERQILGRWIAQGASVQ